jgi:hypothetical protein
MSGRTILTGIFWSVVATFTIAGAISAAVEPREALLFGLIIIVVSAIASARSR